MKFKEYVENLNKLLKENPEIEAYEVVTSSDDEGNEYNEVDRPAEVVSYLYGAFMLNAVCLN